jgi:magnesium-protoporphyrin O-methyltransferase
MTCHAHCCALEGTFDHTAARRDLDRYRRKGPSSSTQELLVAIRDIGLSGAAVLDVGGGVGAIAHELLASGAERATLVDASAAYLVAAREEAERRETATRLQVMHGDFTAVAADIPRADIVTLDKVVCCYPDMQQLIALSTERAARFYGIVYPRDAWWLRIAMAVQNAFRRVQKSAFRVYIFPNAAIDAAVRHAGFALRTRSRGLIWIVSLYERSTDR